MKYGRFLVLGDLHLDQSTAGVDRFEDGAAALGAAVAKAIELQVDAFIFPGDLADPHTARAHRAAAELAKAQAELRRNLVLPIFLAGNHDVVEDGSGSSVLDALAHSELGLVLTRPRMLTIHSLRLRSARSRPVCTLIALPFTPSSHNYDPDAWVRALPPPQDPTLPVLVVGHLNLEGITVGSETTEMPRGRDVFWPLEALRERFPGALLVGGHYHAAQEYQGVHIVGSAARLRFDERDNEPGYLVLEV